MSDDKRKIFISKLLQSLKDRRKEKDDMSERFMSLGLENLMDIIYNSKRENRFDDTNENKIKQMTPKRDPDELMDIVHEGIDFKVKIWYDEKFNQIFKIAESDVDQIINLDKFDSIDEILNSLFKSESFNMDKVSNLKRLIKVSIEKEDYERAKMLKGIMEKAEEEKKLNEEIIDLISIENEKIVNESDYLISDESIKKIESVLKKIKKNRKD